MELSGVFRLCLPVCWSTRKGTCKWYAIYRDNKGTQWLSINQNYSVTLLKIIQGIRIKLQTLQIPLIHCKLTQKSLTCTDDAIARLQNNKQTLNCAPSLYYIWRACTCAAFLICVSAARTLRASTQYAKLEQNGSDSHLNLNNYKGFCSMNLAWKLVSLITLCDWDHFPPQSLLLLYGTMFCWICNVVRKLWLLF